MKSRSQRHAASSNLVKTRATRTKRNEYLYDEMNNKIGLEVINIDSQGEVDLSSFLKDENDNVNVELKDRFLGNSDNLEQKNFDVNSVLEEAKKNRTEIDELEKKRKLKNEEYSVLSNLNRKYITQKEKLNKELEEEGLQELINTITSNTLSNDIKNQELFSDLMATSTDIDLEDDKNDDLEVNKTKDGHLINSFYTRSMDLSEEDFEMSDEFVEPNKNKKVLLIIMVILILLLILGTVGYFVLKWKNII